jgi:hypothetical protein
MERKTSKKVVVSKAAVKLEGQVVPAGHQRSAATKAYLAKQQPPN